jgi:hypothetical protein
MKQKEKPIDVILRDKLSLQIYNEPLLHFVFKNVHLTEKKSHTEY